jgi:hypothetical protein
MLLSTFLPFLLQGFDNACPSMILFAFTLCAEFLEESFVMVAFWSYVVVVSADHEILLLLYLF